MTEIDQSTAASDGPAAAAAGDVEDDAEGISLVDADNDATSDDDVDDDDAVEVIGEDQEDYYNDDDDAAITTSQHTHGTDDFYSIRNEYHFSVFSRYLFLFESSCGACHNQ